MIRQELEQWKLATDQLLSLLDHMGEEERDETIAKVEQLLTLRDQLQKALTPPFTEEEQAFGQEVLRNEAIFQKKLASAYQSIRQDLSVTQSKKSHMTNYMNPYRNIGQDGAYYDTKQ